MSTPTRVIHQRELVQLLAGSLGDAKAGQEVREAARTLGLTSDEWSSAQALQVLEQVARRPGIVGVTARFVKSRMLLQWAADV